MTTLAGFGLAVGLPPGWDGRIFGRPSPPGRSPRAALHAGPFALPAARGDFGSGAVELMGPDDMLVVLLEYGQGCVSSPLFRRAGLPVPLSPADFHPSRLQRRLRGQAGAQAFFTSAGRALCLYVVLGSYAGRMATIPLVNRVLETVTIEAPMAADPDRSCEAPLA